ncbi:MAG TPA: DUF4149 domain-containing protein [Blastocatellia bacterium]|jgi:Domain of unknown function (DUF4149)|nr:DUF4149 domain-containing protein [Blastocatellia bacterium]
MAQRIRLALLGLWLGAMSLFSFVVAPSAFAVLPTRQLAGDVVSRVLGWVEVLGLALGALLLVIWLLTRPQSRKRLHFEFIVLTLMTGSMAVSHFFVSARLRALRSRFGDGLSLLAADDPTRVTFDRLHQVSVWLMGFTLLAALALIIHLVRRDRSRGPRLEF